MPSHEYDAVVVGSGPNGLAAAVTIARAGHSVLVIEAGDTPGGGMRTKELTLPGFRHDVCSAIHPIGVTSPVLTDFDIEWVHPDLPVAHPLPDGDAAELHLTVDDTVEANGEGPGWRRLFGPIVKHWPATANAIMGPPINGARHPVPLLRYGIRALASVSATTKLLGPKSGALYAGITAHANTSLTRPLSNAAGLALVGAGHVGGWPMARGGSQSIADAMVARLLEHGGRIETGRRVTSIDELPRAKAVLFDTTPWQLLDIAGHRLPTVRRWRYRRFRHGNGSFKIDYALDGPMPWT
jgi:phytoene dehydrogenase-like protein